MGEIDNAKDVALYQNLIRKELLLEDHYPHRPTAG